jgi:hypothetical protein
MKRLNCYRHAPQIEKMIVKAFDLVKFRLTTNIKKALNKETLIVKQSKINQVGIELDNEEDVILFIYLVALIKSDIAQTGIEYKDYVILYNLECVYKSLACKNINYKEILRVFELEPLAQIKCVN